jgi:K+-sensing histidine kinase KdpD
MALREVASRFGSNSPPQDEAPSQAMLPVADQAVLCVCSADPELDKLCKRLIQIGTRPKVVSSIDQAPTAAQAPQLCLVEWSLPGAAEYIEELSRSPQDPWPVALVESTQCSARAYASGALSTISRSMLSDEAWSCLQGLRNRRARRRMQDALIEHDQRVSAAAAFEATLRTLGQELRAPLATALANTEFLTEVAQAAVSPISDEEHLALVSDSLEALQQLRATLEAMSVLLPRDPTVLEQVRLWSVAQRVIDHLPSGPPLVELQGDTELRGWGDESTLVEVTSILVKRAIERHSDTEGPRVTLHVYAHDTEARLTIRGRPTQISNRRTSDDPFKSTRSGHGGLALAAARHAVVKMGGMLSYVPQKETGSAFRVRLRLA